MSDKLLIRWAGMAAILSGALFVITDVLFFAASGDVPTRVAAASGVWLASIMLDLVGTYLGLLALVGLYARQSAQSGTLGLVAFVLASLGTSLNIGYLWAGSFVVPHLTDVAPGFLDMVDTEPSGLIALGFTITFLLFALGWALMGYATTRARILPRRVGWSLVVGSLLNLVLAGAGLPFGTAVLGLALAWLGWSLWSERTMAPM
jgi:hypothetical protein